MNAFHKSLLLSVVLGTTFSVSSCVSQEEVKTNTNYVSYVDPYIGSAGHGHVFIGANVPFGALQLGPSNIHKGWDWCSAYHYSDSIVIGFSHTHLSGTGCTDLGDILFMPYTGKVRTARGEQNNIEGAASSYYSHENETVSPGYYSLLMDNGVKVELTATERVGMHRYKYPSNNEHRLLINLEEGNGDEAYDTYLKKIDDYNVEGYRFSEGWSHHKVFFAMKSNQKIESLGVFDGDKEVGKDQLQGKSVKGVITFAGASEDVLLKVSISSVSCENARMNMESELPDWDFDNVHKEAINKWNKELAKVDIETKDERAKKIFYTSMYHAFIAPTKYCDVNGDFRGHDDTIYQNNSWENYSTFSLWDTYRTLNPLFTILKPSIVDDFINSYMSIYDQQGKLPIWPLVGGETECMPGYSAVPIIADAYLKGIKGFDAERAYQDMVSSATYDKQKGVPYVLEKGYIPCDKLGEGTSVAMEYAVDDWGIAMMAKKMGKMDDYKKFLKRGKAYEYYFDKSINYIRPKMNDGSWRTPYNPFKAKHGGAGDFTEGNGWQYTFFVPQYPEGLIALMGGDDAFVTKLDSFFVAKGDLGPEASADITGLIGQYAHGNEPSHHIAYLYTYAGEQWKTAEQVRYIQKEFYTDQPDGIIGNEDCGQMSAWHIISALGFYQVNPSNGIFVFGSPLFDKASINLENGKIFEVITENNSDQNIYIQSVELNGKVYEKSYITYDDIMKGGTLKFVMGNVPNKEFGAYKKNRPMTIR